MEFTKSFIFIASLHCSLRNMFILNVLLLLLMVLVLWSPFVATPMEDGVVAGAGSLLACLLISIILECNCVVIINIISFIKFVV